MAIEFTDADREAGLACAKYADEEFGWITNCYGKDVPVVDDIDHLAAVFTDRISTILRPKRERAERIEKALRSLLINECPNWGGLPCNGKMHRTGDDGCLDECEKLIEARAALGEETK